MDRYKWTIRAEMVSPLAIAEWIEIICVCCNCTHIYVSASDSGVD